MSAAKSSASGQAAAKAKRTRLAISTASGDLEQLEAQCGELGLGQVALFRNGVADGEHEPVCGGVENEADLVGERRAARRAIGGELSFVQLDEIFRSHLLRPRERRCAACPRAQ